MLTAGTHILSWNYGVKYLLPNPKQFFKLKCIVFRAFRKADIFKVELSMIKICEFLRKLWYLRSGFLILPPGALLHGGLKVWWSVTHTLQWCASRGWVIAHENLTSCTFQTRDAIIRLRCFLASASVLHFIFNKIYSWYSCLYRKQIRD